MVALPTSSPTLVSSSLPSSTSFASFGPHSRNSSCSSSRNLSPGPSAPSSPSSSSGSSPQLPCMEPVPGRVAHSPSATISSAFPIPVSHTFSKALKTSSSDYYNNNNTMKVKNSANTTSLDQPIIPIKSALAKFHGHEDYHDLQQRQQHRPYDHDNASSAPMDSKPHSRIHIANLLCTSSDGVENEDSHSKGTTLHHRSDPNSHQHHQHQRELRAITEEADDPEERLSHLHIRHQHHSSYNNGVGSAGRDNHYGNGVYSSPPSSSHGHENSPLEEGRREPAFAQRPIDSMSGSRPSHPDRYTHNNLNTRPASFSAASSASIPTSASSSSLYTSAPRSAHPGPQHRSASWNTDRYQDYSHSYEQEHQRRTDRSKSDYALHQQNYGPFVGPSSPPLSATTVHKPHPSDGAFTSSSSSVSTKAAAATDASAPLYYHQPPTSSSTSTSSVASYYPSATSERNSHGISASSRPSGVSSSSSARSMHEYAHAPTAESSSSEQHRRQNHGPILPPPSALLSGAVESKPQRIYGRDSTADDNWTPMPRPTRVVPVDAPNEAAWPYKYSNSGMLPPPYSSAPSTPSSSSPLPPYPSSYSTTPVEQKSRRVYGIDAADIPQRLPPPVPSSSYGSSQYSKPLQDIQDDSEGENSRKRHLGQESNNYPRHYVSSMASAYGSQAYGHSAQPSHHHHRHYSSDADRPRYDYENRGWKSAQSQHGHGSSASSSSSYAPPRPYSRPQSPNMDIKPPTWYQNYANSVPPKPQTQSSYQHQDSHYYHRHGHHQQSGNYSSNGYPTDSADHDYDYRGEKDHSSSKHSKSTSQSVHPFDTAEHKSSKSKKPKRIKNPGHDEDLIVMDDEFYAVKAKRKRANASQLSVLNAAFERSYFPSTEERLRLSKQCRMCPRTVQIWFQNKRQSVKAKSEAMEAAVASGGSGLDERRSSNEDSSSDGQKRSIDDEDEESGEGLPDTVSRRHNSGTVGGANRRSNSNTMTPSEAVMSALHIQLDGRSVDYFSRKRRATVAKMEQTEQQKQSKQKPQDQDQPHYEQRQQEVDESE
ncbi:hypothetical protein BGX27_005009 [Mortierella sp. AM989]|nr:hypothetical protein BGX27_005009 [Mortierella sp. AM989]